jgi:hypothetical protein
VIPCKAARHATGRWLRFDEAVGRRRSPPQGQPKFALIEGQMRNARVVLASDTDGTDLDLHVASPDGAHSWSAWLFGDYAK